MALLQAISLLRQKKLDDASKSVNNLLALERAMPADGTVSWSDKAELSDLYSVYTARVRQETSLPSVPPVCACVRR